MKSLFFSFSVSLIFLLFSACESLNDAHLKSNLQKVYTGFSGEDSFQVACNIELPGNSENIRSILIQNCRRLIVQTLAEFKIIYDYNKKYYFLKPQIIELTNTKNQHNSTVKIHALSQTSLTWNKSQVDSLLELYKDIFPGRIKLEWHDDKNLYFLYEIRKNGLLNLVKNRSLPFPVEFQ